MSLSEYLTIEKIQLKFKLLIEIMRLEGFSAYSNYFQALQYKKLFDLLETFSIKNSNILDWGGGLGHLSVMISLLGRNATLFSIVDKSYHWDKIASKYSLNIVFEPEAVKSLSLKDNSFDCAISCGVLEHVRETGGNELESLIELKRVLVKNGIIIVYHLPQKYSWIEFISRNFRKTYSHPYRYQKKDIEALLKKGEIGDLIKYQRYQFLPRRWTEKMPTSYFLAILFDWLDNFLCKTPLKFFAQCQLFVVRVK